LLASGVISRHRGNLSSAVMVANPHAVFVNTNEAAQVHALWACLAPSVKSRNVLPDSRWRRGCIWTRVDRCAEPSVNTFVVEFCEHTFESCDVLSILLWTKIWVDKKSVSQFLGCACGLLRIFALA